MQGGIDDIDFFWGRDLEKVKFEYKTHAPKIIETLRARLRKRKKSFYYCDGSMLFGSPFSICCALMDST